jgi:glyoxylase-like metal-dependent hydrolase (beta-lactamase superfamily II)
MNNILEVTLLRLFIIWVGYIRDPNKGGMTRGVDKGIPIKIPIYAYLLDHPDGTVVLDTGMQVKNWPEFQQKDADDVPELYIDNQLKKLGFNPSDIRYVILSHYHGDHCGGMSLLPDATFIVRKEESRAAWTPENHAPGSGYYNLPDFRDSKGFSFIELDDDEDYDVFGDGKIICIDTKGHTRGHQSVLVNLPKSRPMVLAADAASLRENLESRVAPGKGIWSAECGLKSIDRLCGFRDDGSFIILGHDPEQMSTLKLVPEFYE